MRSKLVVDVDTGVDDAQALILALTHPDFEVMAITCVAGNCDVDQVCINTLKVLKVCNKQDVPVYRGSPTALCGAGLSATYYHGQDGLGDANHDIDINMTHIETEDAVKTLLNLVNKYPGEITLVALAPLTNIALTLRRDPDFGKKLKSITIMGGNTEGRGNVTVCGEFNFASDPEAACFVLNELSVPFTLLPYVINLTGASGHPWEWFAKWTEIDTPLGCFNKAIVQMSVQKQHQGNLPTYMSCDLNTMATIINPSLITDTVEVYATVELDGKYTRGMMVVDWNNRFEKPCNLTLVKKVDTRLARELFERMLK